MSFTSIIVVRDTRSEGFITHVLPPVMARSALQGATLAGEVEGSDAS